ncbi:hypothetical protein A9R01_06220 ['Osedax' symbiont bacterium Rs2_46_30_T18]|nr:hypothetical protein A9R01_06220 ['Osedax' symbiont bacterium Rs2_46_30_T18]
MRNMLFALLIAVISTSFVVPEVQAKRFGGGSKIGKSFFSSKKTAPAAKNTNQSSNKSSAAKKAGFGGLMGGLLAGGLLGAIFLGGGFEGIQMMDILLLALGGFVIFKVIGMLRARQSTSYATPAGTVRMNSNEFAANSANSVQSSTEIQVPAWFNEQQFVKGAESHFGNLQQAWDAKNWDEISGYTNADVLAELKREREQLADDLYTEVVSVQAQLIGFKEEQGFVVAGIAFTGRIKEDSSLVAKEFDETWHMTRDMQVENADWVIAGIEQNI